MIPSTGDLVVGKVVNPADYGVTGKPSVWMEGGKNYAIVEVWGDANLKFPHAQVKRRVISWTGLIFCALVIADVFLWMRFSC